MWAPLRFSRSPQPLRTRCIRAVLVPALRPSASACDVAGGCCVRSVLEVSDCIQHFAVALRGGGRASLPPVAPLPPFGMGGGDYLSHRGRCPLLRIRYAPPFLSASRLSVRNFWRNPSLQVPDFGGSLQAPPPRRHRAREK